MKTYAQRLVELETTFVPEYLHFTTAEEMQRVIETLGLNDMSAFELQNMRDMAVMFFDSDLNDARADRDWDAYDRYRELMFSVTATIDRVKFDRGYAV